MRKIISLILAVCMSVSFAVLPANATEDSSVYYISSAEELAKISKLFRLDSRSKGKTVILKNDIVITDGSFNPIPVFCGTFDGQGHSIKGVLVTGTNGRGFINTSSKNSVIKNLDIIGIIKPTGSESFIGGIVGSNSGTVYNCSFSGSVLAVSGVGCIAGENTETGAVIKCRSAGTAEGENLVGGIVGSNLGSVVQCVNNASVNTTNEEKSRSLEDIDLSLLTDSDSRSKNDGNGSATDIGGIVGLSSGTVFSCENTGSVGYPHVGYNIGGIAGRSSGVIAYCNNSASINGRKDVGGIAGQMEPHIVVNIDPDNIAQLKNELRKLTMLIDTAINESRDDSLAVNSTMETASGYLQNAVDSTDNIERKLSDYGGHVTSEIDRTSSVISDALARLDEISGLVPTASKSISEGSEKLSDAFGRLSDTQHYTDDTIERLKELADKIGEASDKANEAAEKISEGIKSAADSIHNSVTASKNGSTGAFGQIYLGISELSDAMDEVSAAFDEMSDAFMSGDAYLVFISAAVKDLADAVSDISFSLDMIGGGIQSVIDGVTVDSDGIFKSLNDSADAFKELCDALKRTDGSAENIDAILGNASGTGEDITGAMGIISDAFGFFTNSGNVFTEISTQLSELFEFLGEVETVEFGVPDETIKDDTGNLYSSISAFIMAADTLNVQASDAGVTLSYNLAEINKQISVVEDIITDMLDIDSEEDYITDTSAIDTEKISNGKVCGCQNLGKVNGDLNIGGIAGQISIEYAYDPEDDIMGQSSSPLNQKLETKAAALNNKNSGEITARKNCAGGIAGQANLGVIKKCESYGEVVSESGDYVGGAVGKSTGKIIGCYVKAPLSGRNYVGGIAGCADYAQSCYSLVEICGSESYSGAICGNSDGEFASNYFVSDDLCGINGASYKGIAEPIPYEALLHIPDIPEEFSRFSLKFIADDEIIDEISFDYGESFDEAILPDIPSKDGCYAKWDYETLCDLVLDTRIYAEYFTINSSLSSENRRGGKAVWLSQGDFTKEDSVKADKVGCDSLPPANPFLASDTELCERWLLTIPSDGGESHLLRYLVNTDCRFEPDIYTLSSSGEWEKAETRLIGSYLLFKADGSSPEILAVYKKINIPMIIYVSVGAALIAVAIILIIRRIKKLKNAKKTS